MFSAFDYQKMQRKTTLVYMGNLYGSMDICIFCLLNEQMYLTWLFAPQVLKKSLFHAVVADMTGYTLPESVSMGRPQNVNSAIALWWLDQKFKKILAQSLVTKIWSNSFGTVLFCF